MARSIAVIVTIMVVCMSCSRPEQRAARYEPTACPICNNITNGDCSYCQGTKKCMYCKGAGERHVFSPNFSEEDINRFDYEESCPYCNGAGTCTYCNGSTKCWACNGTAKVAPDWKCLVERTDAGIETEKGTD